VAQRSIEVLIGRLITDEAFRDAFLTNRVLTLQNFVESGHELTGVEAAAIHATPATLWRIVANQIDPRLQRAKLSADNV
jgi:hypothetical protein